MVTMMLLLLACGRSADDVDDLGPAATEPPMATLGEIVTDGPWVRVEGTVSDPDQPPWTLLVHLTSDLDGLVWSGAADGDGHWSWSGQLSEGTHQIQVEAHDREDLTGTDSQTLAFAVENRAPSCAVLWPEPEAIFTEGTAVWMEAGFEDRDGDEVQLTWSSSAQGSLFTGASWDPILQKGTHEVTLYGADGQGGECVDAVTVHVQ